MLLPIYAHYFREHLLISLIWQYNGPGVGRGKNGKRGGEEEDEYRDKQMLVFSSSQFSWGNTCTQSNCVSAMVEDALKCCGGTEDRNIIYLGDLGRDL